MKDRSDCKNVKLWKKQKLLLLIYYITKTKLRKQIDFYFPNDGYSIAKLNLP